MKLEQLKVGQRFEAIDLEGETLEVVEGGLLKIVDPKKGKFVPKEGELYWFIECIYPDTRLVIVFNSYVKFPLQDYFKSEEDAEDFIEEAGKDNIKKFMFDVWE